MYLFNPVVPPIAVSLGPLQWDQTGMLLGTLEIRDNQDYSVKLCLPKHYLFPLRVLRARKTDTML